MNSTSSKAKQLKCAVCNASMTQYNIGAHVKNVHDLDPEQYKMDQGLKKTPEQHAYDKIVKRATMSCDAIVAGMEQPKNGEMLLQFMIHCRKHAVKYEIRTTTRLFEYFDYTTLEEYLEHYKRITEFDGIRGFSHEWFALTRGKEYADNAMAESSERVSGENNPAFDHGGRLSPFSTKFVKYQGLEETEVQQEIQNVRDTEGYQNREHNTTLEYWAKRTETEQDAKRALSARQSTFSLDACIDKHGDEEGTRVWRERQDKWQTTLKAKPQEELDRINASKATNALGFGFNHIAKSLPGCLYYVKITLNDGTSYWKIGITSRGITQRFGDVDAFSALNGATYEVLSTVEFDKMLKAYEYEQIILRKFKDFRLKLDLPRFSTTETFTKDVTCGVSLKEFIKEFESSTVTSIAKSSAVEAETTFTLFDLTA